MFTCYTTFNGSTRIAAGDLAANALAARRALAGGATGPVLTFDDASGHPVEIDTRGDEAAMLARLARVAQAAPAQGAGADAADATMTLAAAPRGRGRPKLGVVAREVTLLPRHWEWLEAQPGGASITLRKLVEDARRANAGRDARRAAQERAYRVMGALAGNLPGFEEASRALFADDAAGLAHHGAAWPPDVRDYVLRLAVPDGERGDER